MDVHFTAKSANFLRKEVTKGKAIKQNVTL